MAATGHLITMLAADVVGYSGVIREDEKGILERLVADRHQLVYPRITEHHGRIVRRSGDSLLVEFASATEAVRCAVEVQRGIIDRNIGISPDRRITFRVGVDIGEVAANRDDLVSRAAAALPADKLASLIKPGTNISVDGSNFAARLAALAEPSGICISGRVHDAIRDQLPYTFADIGKQNFDIHAASVQCYAMSGDAIAAKPHVAAQKQRGSPRRSARLRSAGIAASLFATAGIWAAALWAWLDADSAPIRASTTAGSPFVSGTQEQSALQSAPVSSLAPDGVTQAPPPQPPPTSNTAADSSSPALPAGRDLPNIGVALGRDQQAPSALQTMPKGVPAVIRGNQASSGPQPTPDSGMAVVKGNRKPSPLQIMPDNGTVVIRGNKAPSTLQVTPGSGANVVRGS
jgi:adenylate cyclase